MSIEDMKKHGLNGPILSPRFYRTGKALALGMGKSLLYGESHAGKINRFWKSFLSLWEIKLFSFEWNYQSLQMQFKDADSSLLSNRHINKIKWNKMNKWINK